VSIPLGPCPPLRLLSIPLLSPCRARRRLGQCPSLSVPARHFVCSPSLFRPHATPAAACFSTFLTVFPAVLAMGSAEGDGSALPEFAEVTSPTGRYGKPPQPDRPRRPTAMPPTPPETETETEPEFAEVNPTGRYGRVMPLFPSPDHPPRLRFGSAPWFLMRSLLKVPSPMPLSLYMNMMPHILPFCWES
jgi:hypothetical protein